MFFTNNERKLSSALIEYVDLKKGIIVAPITGHYYKNRPIFLISIPKSGTHLLFELVKAFGYGDGVVCPDNPRPGNWYCIEYSNTHTKACDFFIDTVRRSPFGNRHHPFTKYPVILMYRNPLDILISEANYYHQEGNTTFYGYLSNKTFEERLLTLIDDRWLFKSIRDRIGSFIPWLDFNNVIPVSFEELIGPKGGGSLKAQKRIIWSLQLKLHVPGVPEKYGDMVFNKKSATFNEGRIGNHKKHFTEKAYRKFYSLPQDFMEILGYGSEYGSNTNVLPARADEFIRRPVLFSEKSFDDIPIAVEYDYLDHNIVKYRGSFYGIPLCLGSEINYYDLPRDKDLSSAKQRISHILNNQVSTKNTPRENNIQFYIIQHLIIILLLKAWLHPIRSKPT
ncbi:MAG: hypothetical protein ACOY46_15460 [Bacillota bacterium]